MTQIEQTQEGKRIVENRQKTNDWKKWGPYVSDRQWGTVREDYSPDGSAWDFFPHDQARSRAYRWGEDGIAGICDNYQQLCFAIALWNGADPILKERLFGLTGGKTDTGNHGEDVKEYYFYLDNTPTHSYMKCLYKYPQAEYPYGDLVSVNGRNGKQSPEYELLDTKVFEENRYFDVFIEYAKNTPEDILIKISVTNQGPDQKTLDLLPTLWFRNTWSWGLFNVDSKFQTDLDRSHFSEELKQEFQSNGINCSGVEVKIQSQGNEWLITDKENQQTYTVKTSHQQLTVYPEKPSVRETKSTSEFSVVEAYTPGIPGSESGFKKWLYCQQPQEMLYTENETNKARFGWGSNTSPYVKDGINNYVVRKQKNAVNPNKEGTKVSASYELNIAPRQTKTVYLRLCDSENLTAPFDQFETIFQNRKNEADEFYQAVNPHKISDEIRDVQRQAFAGMLWSKQFYYYVVHQWLNGDPAGPTPPESRKRWKKDENGEKGRNVEWTHLYSEDIISMPDKWEYPWFAAWDLAFHTISFSLIDPDFAKNQLRLLMREWYLHPNGQIPAYEWNFGDVNPPVHAWATWRVYEIDEKMKGEGDVDFLEEVFQKLNLYFTWWTNRKDVDDKNIFSGGFLGLDNIGPIDRSHLKPGETIEQADGTAWMGMYCLKMLRIAAELARKTKKPVYETMVSNYFLHFLLIADAMNKIGGNDVNLWNEQEGFYEDVLMTSNQAIQVKARSMVGLIPLFAVETLDETILDEFCSEEFKERFEWFMKNRSDLTQHGNISIIRQKIEKSLDTQQDSKILLSLVSPQRLQRILTKMLDESEFLSPHGIRSVSKYHKQHPFVINFDGQNGSVDYEPAESRINLFGGNSNWRGPIWMPVNFLLVESLQIFDYFLGEQFTVEYPTRSGDQKSLWDVSTDLSYRLIEIFLKNSDGDRPVYGGSQTMFGATNKLQTDENWKNYILFFEYFHGDNGAGLGASHQTGWTGLVAKLIQQYGEYSVQGNSTDTLQNQLKNYSLAGRTSPIK
ncbi:MAG: glucosidase [Rivularia sp. (in: cyanobacteria)]